MTFESRLAAIAEADIDDMTAIVLRIRDESHEESPDVLGIYRTAIRRRASALGIRWHADVGRYLPDAPGGSPGDDPPASAPQGGPDVLEAPQDAIQPPPDLTDPDLLLSLEQWRVAGGDALPVSPRPSRRGQMHWCHICEDHTISPAGFCRTCGPMTSGGWPVRKQTRKAIDKAQSNWQVRLEKQRLEKLKENEP